jgi:uncharacterized membrane-anchored protein YitT (DUF2179 family)
MNADKATELTRKAINVLFVANPVGTSIGVLIGVVLDGIIGLLTPFLKTFEIINIAAIKLWHLVCFGVVSINTPNYLRRKEVDSSIQNAIDYIEEQKNNNSITEWQAKQMYANLHQKVLENVALETGSQNRADRINELVTQPDSDSESNK